MRAQPDLTSPCDRTRHPRPSLRAEQRQELLRRVDARLASLNIEYEAKRKSMRLKAPLLHVMKPGWYVREKQALASSGKRLFQAKTVLLDARQPFREDPENLEAVVSLESDV